MKLRFGQMDQHVATIADIGLPTRHKCLTVNARAN